MIVVVLVLASIAATIALTSRRALPFIVLQLAVQATVLLSTNYWHCRPRLLTAGTVYLLVPLGARLERVTNRALIPVTVLTLFTAGWLGAYMVNQWPYAI